VEYRAYSFVGDRQYSLDPRLHIFTGLKRHSELSMNNALTLVHWPVHVILQEQHGIKHTPLVLPAADTIHSTGYEYLPNAFSSKLSMSKCRYFKHTHARTHTRPCNGPCVQMTMTANNNSWNKHTHSRETLHLTRQKVYSSYVKAPTQVQL